MPSYRVAIDVHGVHPGLAPERLLPRAEELLAADHLVEDRSVEIVGGQPQIHLRFLVEAGHEAAEDEEAASAVVSLVGALAPVADLGRWALRRGPGGRWRTVRRGDARELPGECPVED